MIKRDTIQSHCTESAGSLSYELSKEIFSRPRFFKHFLTNRLNSSVLVEDQLSAECIINIVRVKLVLTGDTTQFSINPRSTELTDISSQYELIKAVRPRVLLYCMPQRVLLT